MNIIVLTQSGRVVSRPDTSWEKDSRDIYLPDFVKALSLSPVLFVKVTKPGRSISERFASRYHDSFGFGCLLYAEDLMDSHPEAYASASCLDHTSMKSVLNKFISLLEFISTQRCMPTNIRAKLSRIIFISLDDSSSIWPG